MNSPPSAWVDPIHMQNESRKRKAEGQGQRKSKSRKVDAGSNPTSSTPRAPKKRRAAAAAAYATGQVGQAPDIRMSRESCRIRHRELIGSVTGSVAFTVAQTFAIQPGLAATFPWLSIMAQGWEQYRFRKLAFCYYTRTGTGTPGSVMIAPDYDAADAAPATEQIASNFEDVVEDAPWKDIKCVLKRLSMAGGQTRHFTRSGPLAANLDIKTYDVGNLHLCTVDGTAVSWGKLWVEYDVEFFVPQLPPTGALALVGGTVVSAVGTTAANPFGTAPALDPQAAGMSMSNASVLTFNSAGTFLISATITGTVITAFGAPTASAGVVINVSSGVINAAGTISQRVDAVTVTVPGATLSYAATATTVTAAQLFVGSGPASSYN